MKLSHDTRSKLYAAVSDNVMDARVTVMQSADVLGQKNASDINELLFRLEQKIWDEIKMTLNLPANPSA